MGRGRAKAKQTKVARDLKYRPMDTDFASLERELRGSDHTKSPEPNGVPDGIPDGYEDLAEEYGAAINGGDGHGDEVRGSRR